MTQKITFKFLSKKIETRKEKREILLFSLLILSACSSPKKITETTTKPSANGETVVINVDYSELNLGEKQTRDLIEGKTTKATGVLGAKEVYSLAPEKSNANIFIDKSLQYGLAGISGTHLYAVDFNNDSYTDLVILPDYYSKPEWYQYSSVEKKFYKLTYDPMPEVTRASYLAFYDFNRDGKKDILLGTLNQKSAMRPVPWRIFYNVSEKNIVKFFEIQNVFPQADAASGVSLIDFDLDGLIDLFQPNWFSLDGQFKTRPDLLWRGEEVTNNGLFFSNKSLLLTDEHRYIKQEKNYVNATPSFGSSICDVDRNGRVDILTSSSNGYANKMWLNLVEDNNEMSFKDYAESSRYAFDELGDKILRGGGNSFFSLCMDYNNDSIPDVMLGSLNRETDPETTDRSTIFTGSTKTFPPKFIRSEFYREIGGKYVEGDRRGVLLDYNNDGFVDVIVDNAGFPPDSRLVFFEQQPDHSYVDRASEFGINFVNPSGTVSLDLNRDGKMDFISAQTKLRTGTFLDEKTKIYVFENQVKNKNQSLRVFLASDEANPGAIGASVEVITNKRKFWRINEYVNGGLPSQNEEGLHFGLGTDVVKEIVVNWPIIKQKQKVIRRYKITRSLLKKKKFRLTLSEDGKIL